MANSQSSADSRAFSHHNFRMRLPARTTTQLWGPSGGGGARVRIIIANQ